jgi:uncharacterized protein YcfL
MNRHKEILGSLVLATLLLTGCGSTDSTTVVDTHQTEETKSKVEESAKAQLQKYLRENGDAYQSASYSDDKKEILLVGIQDTTVTFYKFDAITLSLKEKFSFDNIDGQIGIKKAGSDGKYTIISHKDSDAHEYIFDSIKGELTQEKAYVLKEPKVLIQESLSEGTKVVESVYTPQKQGMAVLIQSDTGIYSLYLYGLEDPSHPLKEYMITAGAPDDVIEDIKMLGAGKLAYTLYSKSNASANKLLVTYDYFGKKELSSRLVEKEGGFDTIEERLSAHFREYDAFEVIMQITDTLYLVDFHKNHNSGEFSSRSTYSKVVDISNMSDEKLLTTYLPGVSDSDGEKELINRQHGLEVDRVNHKLIYHVDARDTRYGRYDYVTGVDTRYYDYLTHEVTKVMPVRLDIPDDSISMIVPFYDPDKKFIFTASRKTVDGKLQDALQMYDAQGNYLKDIYSTHLDVDIQKSYWDYKLVNDVVFLGNGQMRFKELLQERYTQASSEREEMHRPQESLTITLDYLASNVVSMSAIERAVGTTNDIYNKESVYTDNQDYIVSIVPYHNGQYTTVMLYDKHGDKIKEIYSKVLHQYYLQNIELTSEDTVSFIQLETFDGKDIYQTDKHLYFKVTVNYKTAEVLLKEEVSKPAK